MGAGGSGIDYSRGISLQYSNLLSQGGDMTLTGTAVPYHRLKQNTA